MWPQIIVIVLFSMGFMLHVIRHNEQSNTKYNWWAKLIAIAIWTIVLYYGGFWNPIVN